MTDENRNSLDNADTAADESLGWMGVVAGLGLVVAAGIGMHAVMLSVGGW
jgi:hypothetical protein